MLLLKRTGIGVDNEDVSAWWWQCKYVETTNLCGLVLTRRAKDTAIFQSLAYSDLRRVLKKLVEMIGKWFTGGLCREQQSSLPSAADDDVHDAMFISTCSFKGFKVRKLES